MEKTLSYYYFWSFILIIITSKFILFIYVVLLCRRSNINQNLEELFKEHYKVHVETMLSFQPTTYKFTHKNDKWRHIHIHEMGN